MDNAFVWFLTDFLLQVYKGHGPLVDIAQPPICKDVYIPASTFWILREV